MIPLSEAKKLVRAWARDPVTGRRADSIWYHFGQHGGTNLWAYLRAARKASLTLRGTGVPIDGRTEDTLGYKVPGEATFMSRPKGLFPSVIEDGSKGAKMKTLTAAAVAPEMYSDVLAERVKSAAQEASSLAFPSYECETLARKSGVDYQQLVSDLDTYFYDVWSPANGVKKLARKPGSWRDDLRTYLQKPFFDRYPQYALVKAVINQDDTPELCRRFALADRMREDLIMFLSGLQSRS